LITNTTKEDKETGDEIPVATIKDNEKRERNMQSSMKMKLSFQYAKL